MLWNKNKRHMNHEQFDEHNINININVDVHINVNDKPWTKEEMTLAVDGYLALAEAVVLQWIKDGKPEKDLPGVKPWIGIVKEYGRSRKMHLRKK